MAATLRTSLGSNKHSLGDACIDLYAEKIMIPRVFLSFLLAGITAMSILPIRHRRRRRQPQVRHLNEPFPEKVVLEASISPHGDELTSRKRWFACFLATSVAWVTVFLCTFNSSTAIASTSMSAAQARPRIVFSFTTTPRGIDEMQPTVDALVRQEGDGFDAVYVIVPRTYRDKAVQIPEWLLDERTKMNQTDFRGISFATGASPYHDKLRLIVLDTDFGPASKVLGTLLVEQDPDTIIVYGDDDRIYPTQLCERALHYTHKFPDDAIAVLGGWISAEDDLYCGRSLAVGVNSVSFVGGAGGVAVKRKFFGLGEATMPAFEVANMSKAEHPGGANVEHYQQCIRELGKEQDLSHDGEFGSFFVFSHVWGIFRGLRNLFLSDDFVPCFDDTNSIENTDPLSPHWGFFVAFKYVIECRILAY
ncbi:Pentatricopeptide repeat-containing protein, chloroplastic [Phytophthora cinnamomi]|uniref:Pentatricopeptide repeat-containing protein, chloroplastic n=1 Tax=Phytophthora cinnamomi TaxID=4785 RepID=UPI00355A25EA|nr:Pentatricopeptide repeat-containing protein, chloroplastic [Phytophthora cinnamomi]